MSSRRVIRYGFVPAILAVCLVSAVGAVHANSPSSVAVSTGPTKGHANRGALDITPRFVPSPQAETFVPVTPCRLLDTRVSHHRVTAKTVHSYYVSNATRVKAQGGNRGGCNIPTTATALSLTIGAISPRAGGWLTAWPSGAAQPKAYALRMNTNASASAGLTVGVRPGASPALSIYLDSTAAVDLTIDVYGYYEPQTHLIILADGTVWFGNNTHVVSVSHSGTGNYTLAFDRSLDGCNVLTTSNYQRDVQAVGSWGASTLGVSTSHEVAGVFTAADEAFQVFVVC